MREDYTHIAIALDSSGSMESIKADTIGGFNTLIEDQKNAEGVATLSLADFNCLDYKRSDEDVSSPAVNPMPTYPPGVGGGYNLWNFTNPYSKWEVKVKSKIDFTDVQSVQKLTNDTYVPMGGTPLLDLVSAMIDETGKRLELMPEALRPAKVLFVIITDGGENQSSTITLDKLKEKIEHQKSVYKWEFMFIGANQDSISAGMSMGISASTSANYTADAAGVVSAYSIMSSKMASYRNVGATADTLTFSDDERKQMEGTK